MTVLTDDIKSATKFTRYDKAKGWCSAMREPSQILIGDNDDYWVVTNDEAKRLMRCGYEPAREDSE